MPPAPLWPPPLPWREPVGTPRPCSSPRIWRDPANAATGGPHRSVAIPEPPFRVPSLRWPLAQHRSGCELRRGGRCCCGVAGGITGPRRSPLAPFLQHPGAQEPTSIATRAYRRCDGKAVADRLGPTRWGYARVFVLTERAGVDQFTLAAAVGACAGLTGSPRKVRTEP